MISELVSNALKHAFPGRHSGMVTVEFGPADGNRVALCVRDDGVGVPAAVDPVDSATLGLQLVSNLAGQLGGQLMLDQPDGVGAAFSVVFPAPECTLSEGES